MPNEALKAPPQSADMGSESSSSPSPAGDAGSRDLHNAHLHAHQAVPVTGERLLEL